MNEEYLNLPLIKDSAQRRFELKVDSNIVFIDYKEHGKKIWLIHTESPEVLKGKGAATAIIEKALAYIEENGYTLIPLCPLVVAYLKHHPERNRILDRDFKT